MNVFVVLINAMGGAQLVGVSATQDDARDRLSKLTFGANRRVEEVRVVGDQPEQNVVFAAEYYDRTFDVHFFEAVYGNYEAARKVVGEKGLVSRRTL